MNLLTIEREFETPKSSFGGLEFSFDNTAKDIRSRSEIFSFIVWKNSQVYFCSQFLSLNLFFWTPRRQFEHSFWFFFRPKTEFFSPKVRKSFLHLSFVSTFFCIRNYSSGHLKCSFGGPGKSFLINVQYLFGPILSSGPQSTVFLKFFCVRILTDRKVPHKLFLGTDLGF